MVVYDVFNPWKVYTFEIYSIGIFLQQDRKEIINARHEGTWNEFFEKKA